MQRGSVSTAARAASAPSTLPRAERRSSSFANAMAKGKAVSQTGFCIRRAALQQEPWAAEAGAGVAQLNTTGAPVPRHGLSLQGGWGAPSQRHSRDGQGEPPTAPLGGKPGFRSVPPLALWLAGDAHGTGEAGALLLQPGHQLPCVHPPQGQRWGQTQAAPGRNPLRPAPGSGWDPRSHVRASSPAFPRARSITRVPGEGAHWQAPGMLPYQLRCR